MPVLLAIRMRWWFIANARSRRASNSILNLKVTLKVAWDNGDYLPLQRFQRKRKAVLMPIEGFAAVLFLVGGIIVVYALLKMQRSDSGTNNPNLEAAALSRLLGLIDSGSKSINLVSGEMPLVLLDQERAVAVLPKSTLWEPRAVRISSGGYGGTSFRIGKGFWIHSGRSKSTSQSLDKLQAADRGTLVVTNKRIAFLGVLKTVCTDLKSIVSIDTYQDGIGLHLKNKQKVECFNVASNINITWTEGDQKVSVPFGGQILEHVVKHALRFDEISR